MLKMNMLLVSHSTHAEHCDSELSAPLTYRSVQNKLQHLVSVPKLCLLSACA